MIKKPAEAFMDVRTIIILNFFGFSSMTILTYTYLHRNQTEVLKEHFKAQVLFTLAFLFFSLLGIVPSVITQIVGNFGVLMGGGFELYAFMRLTNRVPKFERRAVFGVLGAVWVISVFLSAFGDQSNLRIALITLSLAVMWGWTAYALLSNHKRSQLRTLIGVFYLFFVVTMLLRAYDALDFSRTYTIDTISNGQILTLVGIFFYMINSGSGTLLLIKEEDDAILTRYATVDGLTDLYNRRFFVQEVVRSVALCKRKSYEFSMVILDIDHFKQINDSRGHAFGDDILIDLAQLLKEKVRPYDVVGRIGGEEFAIFMYDLTAVAAFQVAERIRRGVLERSIDGEFYKISLGIASVSEGAASGVDYDELFRIADAALYSAKNEGRNQTVQSIV